MKKKIMSVAIISSIVFLASLVMAIHVNTQVIPPNQKSSYVLAWI